MDERCAEELRIRRLIVEDAQGRDRVIIGDGDKGFPSLTFLDPQGVARLVVELSEEGAPMFTMRDPKGVPRVSFSCSTSAALSLCDSATGWRTL